MHPDYNALAAWGTVAAAVGTFVAIIAAILTFVAQTKQSRFSLGVDILLKFDERWSSDDMIESRRCAARKLLAGDATGVDDVMDFFATVGLLLRRGVLDDEMTWATFFIPFNNYWNAASTYIANQRRSDPTVWSSVAYLNSRLVPVEKRKRRCNDSQVIPSQSDLRQFLQTESQLHGGEAPGKKAVGAS